MPRIVAGSARGRRLSVPPSATRPTSDRVREALFSALESRLPAGWQGLQVLDLFAGSGALGLEALSRGAATAVFVERDAGALGALRANIRATGLPGARVVAADVHRWARTRAAAGAGAGLVLADPPYDVPAADVATLLARLLQHGWIAAGALVVVERAARGPSFPWPAGLIAERDRRYGDTVLWYGHEDRSSLPAPG